MYGISEKLVDEFQLLAETVATAPMLVEVDEDCAVCKNYRKDTESCRQNKCVREVG